MKGLFQPHPSWELGEEDLAHPLSVHTMHGTVPTMTVSPYHLDFATIEMRRPLSYYESRVRAIQFTGKQRILDAGCGVGQWSLALARHNGEVQGVDLAVDRLRIGEHLARKHHAWNMHFTHGSLESLPFHSGYFDAVFCYGVFMFLDARAALAEFSRVLKPGGSLYICGNGFGWSLYLMYERKLLRTGLRTIYRTLRGIPRDNFLTRRRLKSDCRRAGLAIKEWGGEGTLQLAGQSEALVEPVYPGRFKGCTAVFEMVAEKEAGVDAEVHERRPADGAPHHTFDIDIDALTKRAQDFSSNRYSMPAHVSYVTQDTYAVQKLEGVNDLSSVEKDSYLSALVARLVGKQGASPAAVEAIVRFAQEAIYHNPFEQPPLSLHPYDIIQLGEGRCGHAAKVVTHLLRCAGFAARIRQFPAHVIAEVFLEGQWRIIDADVFKNGILPKNECGELLSMRDVDRHPYRLDRFPPTGLWMRTGTRYARNVAGIDITGYVDVVNPEHRGYWSGKYVHWIPQKYPPSLPRLNKQPDHPACPAKITLSWEPSTDSDGDVRGYRVRIGTTSKGYSWNEVVYDRLLNQTGTEVGQFETTATSVVVTIERPGDYYWSVQAIDDHVMKEPRTFYWSSDEDRFRVG